jgi:hypothetical protein
LVTGTRRADPDGDDTRVRLWSRVVGILPGTVCTMGAAIMFVATFLPYLGWYGDALPVADEYPNQVSSRLISGSDVGLVVGTIVILAVAAACHMAGFHRRITSVIALGASLVAVDLAVKLPGTFPGSNYGMPYLIDAGVSVFRDGALTSLVAAVLMAVTGIAFVHPRSAVTLDRRPYGAATTPT